MKARGLFVDGVSPDRYDLAVSRIKENIAARRIALGMKAGELAQRLGVVQSVVSEWENNTEEFKAPTLIRLALALDCTVDDLLAGEDAEYDIHRAKKRVGKMAGLTEEERAFVRGYVALREDQKAFVTELIRVASGGTWGDLRQPSADIPPVDASLSQTPRRQTSPAQRRIVGRGGRKRR